MKNIAITLTAVLIIITLGQGVPTGNPPPPSYQLNLSHIECVGNSVEVHFVLLFTKVGDNISNLTYTYGTIPRGPRTGNVVHFTDHLPSGNYNITSATVFVNGRAVTLHNPGEYAGNYNCGTPPTKTATRTPRL